MFGAAVRPDGTASATLARRTAMAARAAAADPAATIFCSGAVGRHPPSEAAVMATLLQGLVAPGRIHRDEASRDTLQTVAAAVAFARATGCEAVVACTDRYHQPRVRMLFRLFGMACIAGAVVPPAHRGTVRYRIRMGVREAAALPYDLVAGAWAVRRAARRPR